MSQSVVQQSQIYLFFKTKYSIANTYIYQGQDQTAQAVVQQSQIYLSSKTKSCLVKGWNEKNKNNGIGRLPTIQNTDTLLLGSQNTLAVLHSEKLVSSGTNDFWYGPEKN